MLRRGDPLKLKDSVPTAPIMLATWSSGQSALAAGWPGLAARGSTLDAVETAIRHAEADLSNTTVGVGGTPDRDGNISLDAAVMLSPAQAGAVCAVRRALHPITVARRVMERTPHNLVAGEAADQFAVGEGLESGPLLQRPAAHLGYLAKSSPAGINRGFAPTVSEARGT